MTLVNDLFSVEDFVKTAFPTATTEKQTVPKKPAPNTFVIRFLNESPDSETAAHVRKDRDYQIVYFADNAADVLMAMSAMSDAFYRKNVIPIKDSLRYIRVESFSFSQPFETDNKLFACIGVLSTQVRENRKQEPVPLINEIYIRV